MIWLLLFSGALNVVLFVAWFYARRQYVKCWETTDKASEELNRMTRIAGTLRAELDALKAKEHAS